MSHLEWRFAMFTKVVFPIRFGNEFAPPPVIQALPAVSNTSR